MGLGAADAGASAGLSATRTASEVPRPLAPVARPTVCFCACLSSSTRRVARIRISTASASSSQFFACLARQVQRRSAKGSGPSSHGRLTGKEEFPAHDAYDGNSDYRRYARARRVYAVLVS